MTPAWLVVKAEKNKRLVNERDKPFLLREMDNIVKSARIKE
jgi:hypothetical protein